MHPTFPKKVHQDAPYLLDSASMPARFGNLERRDVRVRHAQVIEQDVSITIDVPPVVVRRAEGRHTAVDQTQVIEENAPIVARIADLNHVLHLELLDPGPGGRAENRVLCTMLQGVLGLGVGSQQALETRE